MEADDSITEFGLAAPTEARGRVLIIACGALAREILALKALNRWDHLDLQCLPAKLHLWPDRIPDAVAAAVEEGRGRPFIERVMQPSIRSASVSLPPPGTAFGYFADTPTSARPWLVRPPSRWQSWQARLLPA